MVDLYWFFWLVLWENKCIVVIRFSENILKVFFIVFSIDYKLNDFFIGELGIR